MIWRSKRSRDSSAPRILIITQFYPPEPCAAANRVAAMVRAFVADGFRVEVVTGFPSFPNGKVGKEDRVLFRTLKIGNNLRLTRLLTYASTRLSGRNRILNWLSVSVSIAVYLAFNRQRYDFVLVTMPPITLALPALVARLRYRSKLVSDVRDVFPDVAVKMGYWRQDGVIARMVGAVASLLYRASHLVLCVTESARDELIARNSDVAKTFVAANGFDAVDASSQSPYARKATEFVAAFVGNMGLATGLDIIIDAAQILKQDERFIFVLAGGGADKNRLAMRIRDLRLTNVQLLGVVARNDANALIADADVSIVPLHPAIVDSLPTKIFDALLLGCPVICCANGEARTLIERSRGGVFVPPTDAAALAEALREMAAHPERRASYAASGSAFIANTFDRARIMGDVATRLRASWALDSGG